MLVTSRSPLHVSGEREYRLEPLPASDAAALFVERARAVGRELAPDSTVEAICRRLDGLPLAVELAAARTKLLAPERLLERLDSALPLLTGGARDAPERQRTLRATIEWSYDLLDPAVKELFARLSVFAGSFPLAAAEEVCGADLDGLAALVDSSLLKPIGDDRFLMLETIREYALERLAASEEAEELRRRHADFFAALAEQAYERRFDAEAEWSGRLELDHDDLRAALDWLAANDPDGALELAGALGWFWLSHGLLAEGVRTTGRGARRVDGSRSVSGPRAHGVRMRSSARHGDVEEGGRSSTRRSASGASSATGTSSPRRSTCSAGSSSTTPETTPAPSTAFEQSLELRRELGDSAGETRALVGVCQVLVALGRGRASRVAVPRPAREGRRRSAHRALRVPLPRRLRADPRRRRGGGDALPREPASGAPARRRDRDELRGAGRRDGGGRHRRRRSARCAWRESVEALWESLGISISRRVLGRASRPAHRRRARGTGRRGRCAWAEGRAMAFEDAVEFALSE